MSPRIKLCGLRSEHDLRAVAAARPDAVGFVLAPSPRQVDLDTLARLLEWLPDRVQRWAVFREPDADTLTALTTLPLTGVQAWATWSGVGLPARFASLPVFRDHEGVVDDVRNAGWDGQLRPVRGLIGAFVIDGAGGGGLAQRVDPARARAAADLGPLVLAGGLDPSNVADAITQIGPYAVDVSSGIEAAPGVKDADRVDAFARAVRGDAR